MAENKNTAVYRAECISLHFCEGLYLNAKVISAAQLTRGETLSQKCTVWPSPLQTRSLGSILNYVLVAFAAN